MKTQYKYIHFEIDAIENGEWVIYNNKTTDILGYVNYYGPWKQWTAEFQKDYVFNTQCLLDIADFLGQLNKGKKKKANG